MLWMVQCVLGLIIRKKGKVSNYHEMEDLGKEEESPIVMSDLLKKESDEEEEEFPIVREDPRRSQRTVQERADPWVVRSLTCIPRSRDARGNQDSTLKQIQTLINMTVRHAEDHVTAEEDGCVGTGDLLLFDDGGDLLDDDGDQGARKEKKLRSGKALSLKQ
jgi:hypothetical protein